MNDEELIAAYYACNNDALGVLHERYFPALCAYFRTRGCQDCDAEDLAEEVFLRIARTRTTGRGPYVPGPGRSFRAWLFRIARNLLLDRLPTLQGQWAHTLTDPEGLDEQVGVEDDPEPLPTEEVPGLEQFVAAYRACRDSLSLDSRAVLLLVSIRRRLGFDFGWVANTLGVPYRTAAGRLHRARRQLDSCLQARGYRFLPRDAPRPPSAVIVALFPNEFLIYVPTPAAEA
jgi:RNA polymerase sigma factor (sigma-70 family)